MLALASGGAEELSFRLFGPRSVEFSKIVGSGNEKPFGTCFRIASETEPSNALGMFNLADHRFNDRLASCVHGSSLFRLELSGHALFECEVLGYPPARGGF